MDALNEKLNGYFAGKVVRKDLTKKIKEGANVPVYVLEYLLGMYCATDDNSAIEEGIKTVKTILADNFVRPDEAEKIKSKIKEKGIYTIIDKITVKLNEKLDIYQAEFSNLGIKDAYISEIFVNKYDLICLFIGDGENLIELFWDIPFIIFPKLDFELVVERDFFGVFLFCHLHGGRDRVDYPLPSLNLKK